MVDILIDNGSGWEYIHYAATNDLGKVGNGVITQSATDIDSLTFDIYPNNPGYGNLTPYVTKIWASDGEVTEFLGRVIGVTPSMDENGLLCQSITCESVEAYLLDTSIDTTAFWTHYQMEHMEDDTFRMDARDFLTAVFAQHNSLVSSDKQIEVGTVALPADMTYDAPWTYGTTTRDLLQDFLSSVNSHLYTLNDSDIGVTIDWHRVFTMYVHEGTNGLVCDIVDYWNGDETGAITLGYNMGAISREVDYTDIVTCVRPMGEEYDYEDAFGLPKRRRELAEYIDAYEEYVGPIEESPAVTSGMFSFDTTNGLIHCETSEAEHGIVMRPLLLDGFITHGADFVEVREADAIGFINTALAYLKAHWSPAVSLTVTAYDLSLIGESISSFRLFQAWNIIHPLLHINESLLPIVKRVINMDDPASSSIEFGTSAASEQQIDKKQRKVLEQVAATVGTTNQKTASKNTASTASGTGGIGASVGGVATGTNYVGHDVKSGGSEGPYYIQDVVQYVNYTGDPNSADASYYFCWNLTRKTSSDPTRVDFELVFSLQDISEALGYTDEITWEEYSDPEKFIYKGYKISGLHFCITDVQIFESWPESGQRYIYHDIHWGISGSHSTYLADSEPALVINGTIQYSDPVDSTALYVRPSLEIQVMREVATREPTDYIYSYVNSQGQQYKYASYYTYPNAGKVIFQESLLSSSPVMHTSNYWNTHQS